MPRAATPPDFVDPQRSLYWSMELSDEDILEYQEIWKEEFGEEISEEEARRSATELLELCCALFFESPPEAQEEK